MASCLRQTLSNSISPGSPNAPNQGGAARHSITNALIGLVVACSVIVAFTQTSFAQKAGLYGWTRFADIDRNIDFVRIDLVTGKATVDFVLQLPLGYRETRDLTYDPRNGRFYGTIFGPPAGQAFAEIDPVSQSITQFNAFSGLETPGVEGVEYLNPTGLVVSGVGASRFSNVLYVVDAAGVMQSRSIDLPTIIDEDHLGANASGGEIHVLDHNDRTNGFSVNRWTEPFGPGPVLTGVYNGPIIEDAVDLAVEPVTDTFYSSKLTGSLPSGLLRYKMTPPQAQEFVGDGTGYNYPREIWGIAFTERPTPTKGTTWGRIKSLYR